jgi:dethiobiotin synthetase
LGYDYWKPVQAGDLNNTDSMFVKKIVSNKTTIVHPERYRLTHAVSPHRAAELDGVQISKFDFTLPETQNNLIVETAGGIISPLSKDFLNIDLVAWLKLPVILVSYNYLGSINHTLLTIEILKQRKIPVKGIVFAGEANQASESFIMENSGLPVLFYLPFFNEISRNQIASFSENLKLVFDGK